MTFTFPAAVAWDPIGKQAVKNSSFQAFAMSDTGFTTPLTITDSQGNPLPGNILNSGTLGVFPEFQNATNATLRITDPTRSYTWTVNAVMEDAAIANFIQNAGSATAGALSATYATLWKPNTAYAAGQAVISPAGDSVTAKAAFTSGASYDASKWNLSQSYMLAEATLINFAKQPGVDRTGVTSSLAAFQAIVSAATPSAPVVINFPAGKYYFDAAWPTLDYHSVRITGSGADQTTLAWGGAFSGTAITWLANPPAPRRAVRPMSGVFVSGPTASNTTGDCMLFGGTIGAEASLLTLEDVTILGWRDQITFSNGAYIINFRDCNFTVWQRNSAVCPSGLTGAGEGLKFDNCTFSQGKNGAAIKSSYQSAQWVFTGCHFDYNAWDADIQAGVLHWVGCYFEATDNEATTTERIKVSYLNASSPTLSFTSCYLFPLWTMAGTVRQFLRITGTPGTNEGWAPNISFTDPHIYTASTSNVRRLILDEHTLISGSSAPKYARVTVRNPNYSDQGDAFGVYRPLVYKDVDNKEWQLATGGTFEPQRSNKKPDWTGTNAHVFETVPRVLATDKKQVTAGTLYIVRMPQTWAPFRASTWRLSAAIGAVGSADATYARLAVFTGFSNLTNGGLTLFDHGGIGVTSGPNNIKSIDKVSNFGLDPEQNFYLGLLITGTTMPEIWGRNIAPSPLLDRGNMSRPYLVGMLPGQTQVASISDVSTIQNSDFIPWIGLEPVVYA